MTTPSLVECPDCLGQRGFDFTTNYGRVRWFACDTCGGTGRLPENVARDVRAANVAVVDQAMARLREEGRL